MRKENNLYILESNHFKLNGKERVAFTKEQMISIISAIKQNIKRFESNYFDLIRNSPEAFTTFNLNVIKKEKNFKEIMLNDFSHLFI